MAVKSNFRPGKARKCISWKKWKVEQLMRGGKWENQKLVYEKLVYDSLFSKIGLFFKKINPRALISWNSVAIKHFKVLEQFQKSLNRDENSRP